MGDVSSIDLSLLSFLGVNARALAQISKLSDPRDLIEISSLRAKKRLSDEDLLIQLQNAENYRLKLVEFEKAGGRIVGSVSSNEMGCVSRASPPPLCAYVRGNPNLLQRELKVAIVGTRDASLKGISRAREIAGRLSEAGALIVSGGAHGIDSAAHEGAMLKGAETLAVLGDPVDPIGDERPQRLKALNIHGLLTTMTMFGPWVKPSRALFVARNQFVAALVDAVIIVEGRTRSGTLHTATYANKMGVPVWAIPGEPHDEMAQAANWLLERGLARAFVNLDYFLSTITIGPPKIPIQNSQNTSMNSTAKAAKVNLNAAQDALLKVFAQNEGRLTVDELAEKCETPINALQQELLMLELLGVLKKQGTEFVIL